MDDKLLKKLAGIKAVVDRGETEAEREVAARKFNETLAANDLTLDDFLSVMSQEERYFYDFPWVDQRHKKLILQCVHAMFDLETMTIYSRRRRRKCLTLKLTRGEYITICAMLEAYFPAWNKAVDELLLAFCGKHKLTVDSAKGSELSLDEIARLQAIMRGLSPVDDPRTMRLQDGLQATT